ncbi:MAG: hypothetical protein N3G22_03975 [Candidatus Micrarchaeota archaeon]|nr:hypothetical protein [Candidatus Micrarchaeota archaeon]
MEKMTRREFAKRVALAGASILLGGAGCSFFAPSHAKKPPSLMERRLALGEVLFESREGIKLVFEGIVEERGGNAACLGVAKGRHKLGDIYLRQNKPADVLFLNGEVFVRYEGERGFFLLGSAKLEKGEEPDSRIIHFECFKAEGACAIFGVAMLPSR